MVETIWDEFYARVVDVRSFAPTSAILLLVGLVLAIALLARAWGYLMRMVERSAQDTSHATPAVRRAIEDVRNALRGSGDRPDV